ncbi:MAG: hypothetical protein PHF00_12710 [Elusimicrobia bacterium]|nr:hypothetical protein [Elusimicrobiota bacterium]
MRHAFLLRPALWSVAGRVFDSRNQPAEARGRIRIVHEPLEWRLDLELEAGGRSWRVPLRLAPFAGGTAARWRCEPPAPGRLEGSFEFAGKRIFSRFGSAHGSLGGRQTLTWRRDGSYAAEGELLRGGQPLAAWDLVLRPPMNARLSSRPRSGPRRRRPGRPCLPS